MSADLVPADNRKPQRRKLKAAASIVTILALVHIFVGGSYDQICDSASGCNTKWEIHVNTSFEK